MSNVWSSGDESLIRTDPCKDKGREKGLNEEKQQERDPSVCDSGLLLQVLALVSTRTSELLKLPR